MAIFGFKKRKDEKLEQNAVATKSLVKDKVASKPAKVSDKVEAKRDAKSNKITVPTLASNEASKAASVIIRPHVTEKSGVLSQGGVYTFEISQDSNKVSVAKAIKSLYKVYPKKVSIINLPIKNVFVKGRYGSISGMKKALVTLKKGDKIEFV